MRNIILGAIVFILFSCSKGGVDPSPVTVPEPQTPYFVRGLDLSFTPEIEMTGTEFYSGGVSKYILQIAKDKGINTIRLRLWNDPANNHSDLEEVVKFARVIKSYELKFWLDLHYSDTWADPGAQTKPASWQALNISLLKDSVYAFTGNALRTLQLNNALPDYIQIGNEINSGFLWNDGKVNSVNDSNWDNFQDLLNEGIRATREVNPGIKIILHVAGYDYAEQFFYKLTQKNTDYDIIGLSYYPWWHGKDLNVFGTTAGKLVKQFNKPVLIAETAYPYTLDWDDNTNNIIGSNSQLSNGYLATIEGQAKFISDLVTIVKSKVTLDHGGICYWAPDWVAYKGPLSTEGSSWENLALFDFQHNALPAFDSLGQRQ